MTMKKIEEFVKKIRFDDRGLIPVIAYDKNDKTVKMLAYMNEEALRQTLTTKKMCYYSRSRQCLWVKGETSGNTQFLHDCF